MDVVSTVLRWLSMVAPFVAVSVRWISAVLLLLGSLPFLIGLFMSGNGNEADPGLRNGFVLMMVLAILTAVPRGTEDACRPDQGHLGWFGASLLAVLTIVNLIRAFQPDGPRNIAPPGGRWKTSDRSIL